MEDSLNVEWDGSSLFIEMERDPTVLMTDGWRLYCMLELLIYIRKAYGVL
jgi:hypothetical protein